MVRFKTNMHQDMFAEPINIVLDKYSCPHESFVDLYSVWKTTGEHIDSVRLDVIIWLQLPISNLRGQAYD
ncbi:hypothetical protein PR048_018153 [Dryococelus australis]|uniref:Uncharacterized protein n=1 Tax=Dryococelus australis TaxID=614101 RepID=A0ABQ9HBH1_9NEOP|nr:hypothetical protein PR048_018153 [Dryococelus australis]